MSDKTDSKTSDQGQEFHILPQPNKPKEPEKGLGGGKPNIFNTPGPVVPNREALINAGPPASSEELAARTAALNQ